MAHPEPCPAPPDGGAAWVLGADGPFAADPGFQVRAAQCALAAEIEQTITRGGKLICESATGTGKTLAYLIPALLSGRRTIISTGTRALQEQLFCKDVPFAHSALGRSVAAVILKGRSNYLCLERVRAVHQPDLFAGPTRARILDWAARTATGDLSEAPGIAEEASLWSALSCRAEDCLGTSCPSYDRCHVHRARREAAEADLVIVNHHLFFADMLLGEEGFGRLLPDAHTVIFDEAHQLPGLASEFFGINVSSRELLDLCQDLRRADAEDPMLIDGLDDQLQRLEHCVHECMRTFSALPPRCAMTVVHEAGDAGESLFHLTEALRVLLSPFAVTGVRGDRAAAAVRRGRALLERIESTLAADGAERIAWLERASHQFTLRLTLNMVGPEFRRQIERPARDGTRPEAWIFLSATLCVRDSFSHFAGTLALEDAATARWDSAFDYRRQALLYLPPGLPEPGDPRYTEELVERIIPVLEASRGRAFILFTTHRALAIARTCLRARLPSFPVFAQGEQSRSRLLEQFRVSGNGILLGAGSFWEGVDVAGEALSCVIIDKLPFAPPDDPVERARARLIEDQGGNAFRDRQLPQAVVALKQGVGRLIRTASDRGVLVLCDPRLRTRNYGRVFLESLPPMPVSAELAAVQRFFEESREEQS